MTQQSPIGPPLQLTRKQRLRGVLRELNHEFELPNSKISDALNRLRRYTATICSEVLRQETEMYAPENNDGPGGTLPVGTPPMSTEEHDHERVLKVRELLDQVITLKREVDKKRDQMRSLMKEATDLILKR